MFTQESISKVLQDINSRIPKTLKKYAYERIPLTPTIEKVMEEALKSENISQETKDEVLRLKAQGFFNREKIRENPKIVKMIDNWTKRELEKAVKAGRLPDKKQLAELEIEWKKQKENSSKTSS